MAPSVTLHGVEQATLYSLLCATARNVDVWHRRDRHRITQSLRLYVRMRSAHEERFYGRS
ncbi:Hypothetical predicted protein [Olea europaea subsp. europaea]|uniref:Uncharacterized protein n=1 Tax=Olea europaea subsp. europaea TaxID=158383 RepID=A0A8S0SQB2_OLEEU|nr:Hypothetical predicted protein [Olea europaea subsp. europaea]